MMAVMGAALKKGDKVMALDCYFSLLYVHPSCPCTGRLGARDDGLTDCVALCRENGVFKGAKSELKQRKKERKDAKAKGKKDFKETPLSREVHISI